MLGLHAKRGIATTLERVFNNTGRTFGKLEILWTGKTAGICFDDTGSHLNAKVIFPAIDEKSQISNSKFNNMIGFALHELGHAWFTANKPWDDARTAHGSFVGSLINGLEDPRIELAVINSNYAPNSRALFEDLIGSVLDKDGYVDGADKRQIPFILAVEGRRLNGYHIAFDSVVDDSPYAEHLHWALARAHVATNTEVIALIAIELFRRLKDQDKVKEPPNTPPTEPPTEPPDGNPTEPPDGNPTEPPDGDPTEPPDGNPTDDKDFKGGREVEPNDFIEDELEDNKLKSDETRPRPIVGDPVFVNFNWE